MSCNCKDPICNCLERCCCLLKHCVCITCFNLRTAAFVKKEEIKPFQSGSNAPNDFQTSNVSTTKCDLKDERSSSYCDELESDVVFIGSYNIKSEEKKCVSPRVVPEIVLSDSENEPVLIDEKKEHVFKITPKNRNRTRNFKMTDFYHFSSKSTMPESRNPIMWWWNGKSIRNNYQWFRKKANISRFQSPSDALLDQHEAIAVPGSVDAQVIEDHASENSNFNRYFSEASSSCSAYHVQDSEVTQESEISKIKNNSLRLETSRCMNVNNISKNSNFDRYFTEKPSNWNVEVAQIPDSSISRDSLELEINRYGLLANKSHFNPKKQNSWNNYRSAQNGKKMFSEQTKISTFGEKTGLKSAIATATQTSDSAAKSSTFLRNRQLNFPDVSVYDFDEKDNARNWSDRGNLVPLKSYKRHEQSDNSAKVSINLSSVSFRGYSENNSLQDIDKSDNENKSGCKKAKKNKHVSFLLPSCSSEISNDYQQSNRNSSQNANDGESGYKAVKNDECISFRNPSGNSSSQICNDYQTNYYFCKIINKTRRKHTKRRYKRTCLINELTGETMSASQLPRKRRWQRRRISYKVGQAAIGNKIKNEKTYIKREIKKENGFVKKEITYIKREIKKENP